MLPVSNKIERSVVLSSKPNEVWEKSFANPDALKSWFPDKIEGDFAEGTNFFLIFVDGEEEHRCECKMIQLLANECLEFVWHPGVSSTLTEYPETEVTTVKFTLEASGDKTKVTMVESGFAKVGKKRRQFAFEANNGGWNIEMAKLPKNY